MTGEQEKQVVILGGGPAGLTAGYELLKSGVKPIIIEKHHRVGEIARTENYKGFYFDMGGHRFFTKIRVVQRLWKNVLGKDFLKRPRLSRIYYRKKFFYYPLKMVNALIGLGPFQAVLILFSYIQSQIFPYKIEETFEQWVSNRFGKRLFEIFFKTYTEKIWGIPCSELKAEFAAQRIKDLSLKSAILSMVFKPRQTIQTLIDEFDYPRLGPGMLWECVGEKIERFGGKVYLNSKVTRIYQEGNRIVAVDIERDGITERIEGTDFLSSLAVADFIRDLDGAPDQVAREAAQLAYRDFLTVCLIINQPNLFPDNWIYIHEPDVLVGRIQNFKNWSPEMLPDQSKSSLGMEYFCNEGDEFWNLSDAELIEVAKREIEQIGLAKYADVEDGTVYRVEKAYPVYDEHYREHLGVVRDYLQTLENCQTIGRNGLHRYNNQDHSMLTAVLAVRNLLLGEKNDLWQVNAEPQYHENISAGERKKMGLGQVLTMDLTRVFSRMDPISFGVSVGLTSALVMAFATLFLVIKGGPVVGPNLQLMFIFMPGYRVTIWGSLLGLLYGAGYGFVIGYLIAYLRNLVIYLNAKLLHRDIEMAALSSFLDYT